MMRPHASRTPAPAPARPTSPRRPAVRHDAPPVARRPRLGVRGSRSKTRSAAGLDDDHRHRRRRERRLPARATTPALTRAIRSPSSRLASSSHHDAARCCPSTPRTTVLSPSGAHTAIADELCSTSAPGSPRAAAARPLRPPRRTRGRGADAALDEALDALRGRPADARPRTIRSHPIDRDWSSARPSMIPGVRGGLISNVFRARLSCRRWLRRPLPPAVAARARIAGRERIEPRSARPRASARSPMSRSFRCSDLLGLASRAHRRRATGACSTLSAGLRHPLVVVRPGTSRWTRIWRTSVIQAIAGRAAGASAATAAHLRSSMPPHMVARLPRVRSSAAWPRAADTTAAVDARARPTPSPATRRCSIAPWTCRAATACTSAACSAAACSKPRRCSSAPGGRQAPAHPMPCRFRAVAHRALPRPVPAVCRGARTGAAVASGLSRPLQPRHHRHHAAARAAAAAGSGSAVQAISRLAHAGCSAGELRVTAFNGRLFSPYAGRHVRSHSDRRRGHGPAPCVAVGTTPRPSAGGTRARIIYRDLDVEQLGAVYEQRSRLRAARATRRAALARRDARGPKVQRHVLHTSRGDRLSRPPHAGTAGEGPQRRRDPAAQDPRPGDGQRRVPRRRLPVSQRARRGAR